ncbi:hypothetical protein AURDEDRAFT_174540 [Auricularia subglabra TFB-10046 SS5]|uniref:Uncharacterized protein n=1 Tax=Auricularia subglabra (strain TFB-10046 / SS5) TaxID=717982 RepID=J0WT05_AURST|nr:hypothetical protein AURDEDRAFT_174540 [Auricularia subglabra TFB-10046 SS5]
MDDIHPNLTLRRLTDIHTDLTNRMAEWQALPGFTPFVTGHESAPFPFLSDLDWLRVTLREVRHGQPMRDSRCSALQDRLLHMLAAQIASFERQQLQWEANVPGKPPPRVFHPGPPNPIFSWTVPAIAAVVVFLAVLENTFHLSQRGLNFVVAFLKLLVAHVTAAAEPPSSDIAEIRTAFASLPDDITTIRKKSCLEPAFIIFASCPSCSHLHKPTSFTGAVPVYPSQCRNTISKSRQQRACGTQLLKLTVRRTPDGSESKVQVPIRPFAYASVIGCISRQLQNPSLEQAINRTQKVLVALT